MQQTMGARAGGLLVGLAALTMTVLAVLHCYVLERPVKSDDGGFLNPVMEFVHTGRMVYPAYGPDQTQSMMIHPPVHYWLTGLLMKAGLSYYPAAVTLALLAWLALVAAVLTSPWPNTLKVAFLAAGFIPNFVLIDLDPSRSELQMALAWLAALVLLESARLLNWEKYRLLTGSFLLAYASGLHYFALPALGACGFYVVWMLLDLGWKKGRAPAAYAIGGAAIFLIPYCGLFLIPEYRAIRQLIAALDAASGPMEGLRGGIAKAFRYHRQTYTNSYGYMYGSATDFKSIFLDVLKPLLDARVPAVFVATPLLLIWRWTRGLAIAALPFQLSILLFFNHKSLPYYRGEFSLFFAGLFALVFCGAEWLLRKFRMNRAAGWFPAVAAAAMAVVLVADSPAWQIRDGAVFVDELALARAAGKAVLGDNAIVGGRSICLWFTAGAHYYRNFVSDLIYPPDISKLDVRSYFDVFDGVAEEPTGSWLTYNRQKLGTPSWYVNGVLRLQGFYAGRKIRGSQYSYYLAGTRKLKPVEAYFWRGRQFYRFVENPAGDSAVMSLVSPHGGAWVALGNSGPHVGQASWPVAAPGYLMAVALPPGEQDYVTFHVVSRARASAFQEKHPADCTIREVIFGDVAPADAWRMASTVDYHREMTQIYHTTAELLATQVNTSTGERVSLMAPFSPAVSKPMGSLGNHIRYITPEVASAAVVYSPVIDLQGTELHLLSFGLRIRSGRVAVSIVDPDSKSVVAQLFRFHSQPMLQEKALIASEGVRRVQIMIWANNVTPAKTDFEIDSLQIAPAQWRPDARRAQ